MAVSKVLSIVLLGLCGAALANPVETTIGGAGAPTAPGIPAGTGTTLAGLGTPPVGGNGVQDYLSDADKDKVCKVPPSGPGLCAVVGPADDFCSKLAASVSGTAPCCVAPNVCSFKVGGNGTGTTPAGTGIPPVGGAATTPVGGMPPVGGAGTTPVGGAGTPPVGGAGTTLAGNGVAGTGTTAAAGPVVVPLPNTAYVSCNVAPAGFKQLKTCPNSKTIFVFPSASGSPASDLAGTGFTTLGSTTKY